LRAFARKFLCGVSFAFIYRFVPKKRAGGSRKTTISLSIEVPLSPPAPSRWEGVAMTSLGSGRL
jgi:hypothetical protein